MEFTGERLVPDRDDLSDLYYEHVSRYLVAAAFAPGKRVLDLGCGCGYGAALLADRGAAEVVGVDASAEAIEYCRARYARPQARFEVMDATALGFDDGAFDVVVSFEVLEHLADHARFLDEAARVLAAGGVFLVSTPNVEWTDLSGVRPPNPFHVKELGRAEFEGVLVARFRNVRVLEQRRFTGVRIGAPAVEGIAVESDARAAAPPEYFVAVCSNAPLPEFAGRLVEIPYFANLRELTGHLAARDAEIGEKGERIEALQSEVAEKTAWAQGLDRDLARERKERVRAEIEAIHRGEELKVARATLGYRVHMRLRPVVRALRDGFRATPRVLVALLRLLAAIPAVALMSLARVPELVLTVLFAPAALVSLGVWLAVRVASARARRPDDAPGESFPDGVSVVIPTWNARDLLARYLPSLRDALAGPAFPWEVIVVDNGSDDGSAAFVGESFPEFRVLSLPENRGFAEGVNAGARAARYRVLYALNNDMEVAPGFLDAVLPLFADPAVFGVASRIDFPAGKRREESGLTSAWFVRGRLEIGHHFDVDDEVWPTLYAGGGSSAFDRRRFLALGGFDPLYRPFYVEDLDLGYRAWKRGWKVLCQPASRVVHQHRGTIAKRHGEAELDRIYAANFLTFAWRNVADRRLASRLAAWLPYRMARAVLGERRQVPPKAFLAALTRLPRLLERARRDGAAVVTDAEALRVSGSRLAFRERFEPRRTKRPGDRLGVLFVSPYCPYPPNHGGAVRMYNLMREVARRHDVYLVSMIEYEKERESEARLRTFCKDVRFHLRGPTERTDFLDPASVQEFYSAPFARLIELVLGRHDIDIVQMEYTVLAHFLPDSARLKSVLTEIDLYFVSYLRAARARNRVGARLLGYYEWLRMFRYEMKWCDRYDLVLAMSDHDREVLGRYVPASKIAVVTNGVDLASYPMRDAAPEGEEVLFVGNFRHAPNLDSILFFHGEVWPRIKRKCPRATLTIAGGNVPDEVRALADDPGVTVAGHVPDLDPLYARAAVFVAPITRGSGTRLKIVEAMAKGCPVVSTTLGAEGLQVKSGEHLLIADAPEDFAGRVVALLDDPALRDRLVGAARRLVEERYDWRAIAEGLTREYDRLITPGRTP